MAHDQRHMANIFKRMGEPSWLILSVLDPTQPLPGIRILQRVESLLADAQCPYTRLDPSTLHYALKRMENDELVSCIGKQEVEIPGPHGSTRREPRAVYLVSGLGLEVLATKDRLDREVHRRRPLMKPIPKEGPVL